MQLVSIKTSRTPNQVWLTFSDHSYLPFFIDDVVKLGLIKNQEIDTDKFESIIKACLTYLGREYALRQIAISPKTEKIIKHKLTFFFQKNLIKYKINLSGLKIPDIVQEIINFLNGKKLLNPNDFVEYFVKKNSKKSHQQINYLLQQLGVDSQYINQVDFNPENEADKIKKIFTKKSIDKTKLSNYNEKNKIKASLFRRGFSLSNINAAIDDLLNSR